MVRLARLASTRLLRSGYRLDEPAFTALIRLCAATNEPERAIRLFGEMRRPPFAAMPRLRTYNAIMRVCAHSNTYHALSYEVYKELLWDTECDKPNGVTYNTLLYAASKWGDVEMGRAVLREMDRRRLCWPENRHATLLNAYASAQRRRIGRPVTAALRTLQREIASSSPAAPSQSEFEIDTVKVRPFPYLLHILSLRQLPHALHPFVMFGPK